MATNDEISDFLSSNTSGGTPAFKFVNVGDKFTGTICRRAIVDTKDLRTGDKVKNLVLEIEQADGTINSLWVKPSQLLSALGQALKEANAVAGSPLVGDRISVEFYGSEPPKQTGFSPKKLYRVSFKQGDVNRPTSVGSVDDLL